jgi:hypothetical protein
MLALIMSVFVAIASPKKFPIFLGDNPTICDLTKFSDIVFVGEVITHRYPDKYGSLYTAVTVIPLQFYKGKTQPVVEFLVPGGHFGDQSFEIPGMPLIILNTPVLIFMRGNSISGFDKGLFSIYQNQIWRPLSGSNFSHPMWVGENTGNSYFYHEALTTAIEEIRDCVP